MGSLFRKPDDPTSITFMVRGEAGSGKTRFGLGLKRATGKPVAYIGTDRGAKFYAKDPEIGGFEHVETREAGVIDEAIEELVAGGWQRFGGVVVDTITDWWNAEQAAFEKKDDEGRPYIPIRSWRPLRDGHERKLRDLQALPIPTVLICEEKPIYEKVVKKGAVELKEIGSREDSDKKDSYVSDVRLRFFTKDGQFYAEVLKDRTGRFAMGSTVEDPQIGMWVDPPKPLEEPEVTEERLLKAIDEVEHPAHAKTWRSKHKAEVLGLPKERQQRVVEKFYGKFPDLKPIDKPAEKKESEGAE